MSRSRGMGPAREWTAKQCVIDVDDFTDVAAAGARRQVLFLLCFGADNIVADQTNLQSVRLMSSC